VRSSQFHDIGTRVLGAILRLNKAGRRYLIEDESRRRSIEHRE
jgi:hypothetical protein